MKCLCFSDSHGSSYGMKRALSMHPDAEVVFFLGDGLCDFDELIYDRSRMWIAVRGNWDVNGILGDSMVKKTDSITLMGHRIFLTHGDMYGVKYGLDGITKLAVDQNADVVLFGHTHKMLEKYIPTEEGGFYLFNPGSIGGGFGIKPSYGVINITDSGILLSHGFI
ncbi:MAG: YfcE family phosphodiesterase [Clostridia bacterium]|nr:YfcE family phosphodiesterase [Clostridia bacterium]